MLSNQEIDHNYIKLGQLCRLFETQEFVNFSDFKAIVDNDFDVNYKLPSNSLLTRNKPEYSGNTPLHFLTKFWIIYDDYEGSLLEYIIKLGADLTITNDKGHTPLIQAFDTNSDVDVRVILRTHFEIKNSTNIKCKNGISHFHIACSMDPEELSEAVEIVAFFLKAGVSVNERVHDDSPKYPGYTPLHFAAEHGELKIIKLLLRNGANIDTQDTKGIIPLQILIETFMKQYPCHNVKLQRWLIKSGSNIQHDDICSWLSQLKFILNCNNSVKFNEKKKKKKNSTVNQIMQQEFHVDTFIKFDSLICPGFSPLHLATHIDLKTVKLLLLKGANLLAKDANGITPFSICLKKFEMNDIIDIIAIEKRYNLSQLKFTDGTYLLDALRAMAIEDQFEQFVNCNIKNVNTFIPFQSLIWPGYSLFHLGVLFNCCVPNLLSHKADFTMLNMDGLSPLHLAFCMDNENKETVSMILKAHRQLYTNPVNRDNLSHLHIACAVQEIAVVKLMLLNGANPNLPMLGEFYCCYNYPLFLQIKPRSTPLHIAVKTRDSGLVKTLLNFRANPHVADANGVTPFQYAISEYKNLNQKDVFISILNQMLEIDLETWTTGPLGIKTLKVALTTNNKPDVIIQRLVKEFDKKDPYKELSLTRLQVACCIGDLTMVQEELESGVDVNQRISFDSSIWPGDSAMHILFRENPKHMKKIIKLLFKHGVNPFLKNANNLTPFHLCEDETLQTAISLLGKNFASQNPVNNVRLSHFHLCCKTTNVLIVKEFLKSGVDINMRVDYFAKDYAGWTPLHFAMCYANKEVVKLLLDHGADTKITNVDGLPPLHQALFLYLDNNTPNLVNSIIRHPVVNIQDINIFGETILMLALRSDVKNENIVDLLLNIGACVNLKWFTSENLSETKFIFKLANKFSPKIFQRLVAVIPAITMTDDEGRNAFHYVGSRSNCKIFNKSYYKNNIEMLVNNGCELDQKDKRGDTALHKACFNRDYETGCLLLRLGADVNVKNDTGKTPVIYAYEGYSNELKSTLAQHIQILKEVGLYLEESNKNYLTNENTIISSNVKSEMKILDYCLKEKISLYFSADYFFTEQFVVDYRRMQILQRQKICNFCNSRYVRKRFQNLIPFINRQLRKARTRTRLLEPAQAAFNEFINLVLPDLCLDFILNYLNNEDLMNLIRAKNGKLEFAELPENC